MTTSTEKQPRQERAWCACVHTRFGKPADLKPEAKVAGVQGGTASYISANAVLDARPFDGTGCRNDPVRNRYGRIYGDYIRYHSFLRSSMTELTPLQQQQRSKAPHAVHRRPSLHLYRVHCMGPPLGAQRRSARRMLHHCFRPAGTGQTAIPWRAGERAVGKESDEEDYGPRRGRV